MSAPLFELFIPGRPRPAGSKRGFIIRRKTGKLGVALTDMSGDKGKDWRALCSLMASEAWAGKPLLDGPLEVDFDFTMPRPKYHYNSKGALKPSAPQYHTIAPDKTKLTRSAEDALTGIVWDDDCTIVDGRQRKRYGEKPGVMITVRAPT